MHIIEIKITKNHRNYKKLANNNYPIAQRKLGLMYLFGNLVKKDLSKAKKWLALSAENGDKASQEIFDTNLLN